MDFSFYLPAYWPDTSIHGHTLYGELIEQARHAEDLGFATLGIPEHHFINYLTHPSALLTAVRVAGATRRIPIVTSVLVLPFYDIRLLAGCVAQADCLMDGRLQIGVGRGAFRYEFDRLGIPFEESRERFDEALEILIRLLSETEVGWRGKYYTFDPVTVTPRPLQRPFPPLWIAALAPEAIYHCARRGFHVQTTPLRDPFGAAKAQAEGFRRGKTEAVVKDRRLSMLRMAYVAKDERDKREKMAIAHENHRRFTNVFTTPGTVVEGAIVPVDVPETVEDMEKVLIIGTVEECIERFNAYAGLGIDDLLLNMSFGASHADVMAAMERFVTKVRPHIGQGIAA
jgi:alkanesulfonate monooxygenase SsuD/methylene tetrahydromethanopterin reductase-like flavin-dependent oxidoreductase (luciferase family)